MLPLVPPHPSNAHRGVAFSSEWESTGIKEMNNGSQVKGGREMVVVQNGKPPILLKTIVVLKTRNSGSS